MQKKTKPDILLLVLDTLRADRLSSYSYHRTTSPNLDAFAEEGVLFERAISPAQWTIPAHASLFTGEYPTTHTTTQIYDRHPKEEKTLAELLRAQGYATVGFCNNPLLGVVANELDRGFEAFYNYGGTLPERPPVGESRPTLLSKAFQRVSRQLRKLIAPLQDAFARSDLLLRIALHPWMVRLWQPHLNFKGNAPQSIHDVVGYLRTRRRKGVKRPLFAFVNLMETHLPFHPPMRFTRKFAPYYRRDREARDFMQAYNREHYRWMVPLREPLTELQDRVINDMYDTEIAYEDHLLQPLYEYLADPEVRDNTLVIITSDHGEGMNNHNFVGHSLVAYDDLVHVPLVVRYPRRFPANRRVATPVSTRRIFHTALQAAGVTEAFHGNGHGRKIRIDVKGLSLERALDDADREGGRVMSEAYVPDTLIRLMKNEDPEAIETYRCRHMRRAVYRDHYKLIEVGGEPDELFDLAQDPGERHNLLDEQPELVAELQALLETFVVGSRKRRPNGRTKQLDLEADDELAERLRGLGYLD
ncbi:MAG: sulfatase [Anaerolineae bacterium]